MNIKMTQESSVLYSCSNPYQSDYESSTLEQDKIVFLKKTKAELKRCIRGTAETSVMQAEEIATTSRWKQLGKKAGYYFLIFFGLLEDLCGNYIFSSNLFSLIPNLANPYVFVFSIAYTLLNETLFYAFNAPYLQEGLGLFPSKQDKSYVQEYGQQLKLIKSINGLLRDLNCRDMDRRHYEQYIELAKTLNQDLIEKKEGLLAQPEQESTLRKVLRGSLVTFGVISRGLGSYFMAKTLLMALAAPLVGTPLGWILIGFTVVSGLGFYCAMEAECTMSLVSPFRQQFKALKQAVLKFKPQDSNCLDKLKAKMHPRFKTIPSSLPESETDASVNSKNRFFDPATTHPASMAMNEAVCSPATDCCDCLFGNENGL